MTVFGLGDLAFMGAVGGSTALWTPAQITTTLWLDAADASTITTVSGAVSQWNDKSGNGTNVTQSSAGSRPTISASSLNGLNTIAFNGNQFLVTAADFPLTGDPAFSVFYVYIKSSAANGNLMGWGSTVSALNAFGFFDSNSLIAWAYAGSQNYPTTAVPVGAWIFGSYSKSMGAINTSSKAFRNGIDVKTGAASGSTPNIASRPLYLGQWANVASNRLSGNIAEVIITSYDSPDYNRQVVEGYLAWKWGLTANLPSDHPFKSAAPTI